MKKLILIFVLAFPGILFAQLNEDQLWENAKYQSVKNGVTVYYTDVNAIDGEYSESSLTTIKSNMLLKDGIVKVAFLHFNQTVRVYHYDFVDIETIKNFVLAEHHTIEVMNRFKYSFN